MTQEQFDNLPLRLSPRHMSEILDLDDDGVAAWRDLHPETVLERTKRKTFYSKREVAKVLKLAYV